MSRIQQILEKAEREGAVRRTTAAPPPFVAPPVPLPPGEAHRAPPSTDAWLPPPGSERLGRLVTAVRLSPLLVAAVAPHAAVAEQYRTLRTRLSTADDGHPRRVLIVTSPAKGDGKSVTAANLAITMAQEFNRRIVLVDADLRRPTLAPSPGAGDAARLVEVLAREASLDEALVQLPDYQLTVLPAGGRVERRPNFSARRRCAGWWRPCGPASIASCSIRRRSCRSPTWPSSRRCRRRAARGARGGHAQAADRARDCRVRRPTAARPRPERHRRPRRQLRRLPRARRVGGRSRASCSCSSVPCRRGASRSSRSRSSSCCGLGRVRGAPERQ